MSSGISDSTAVLFTHVPSEIVKTWTPPGNTTLGFKPVLHQVQIRVQYANFNDLRALRSTSSTNDSSASYGRQWKTSLQFWDTLEENVSETLKAFPALYTPMDNQSIPVNLTTETSMVPNETVRQLLTPSKTDNNKDTASVPSRKHRHR